MKHPEPGGRHVVARGVSPGIHGFIFFMLIVLATPALMQALSLITADDPVAELRALWAGDVTVTGDGGRHQDFEDRLEESSAITRWARRLWAPAVDQALDRGNARVVFGRRNWLFYRQAVDYVTGPPIGSGAASRRLEPPDTGAGPAAAIVDFHRQLQAAGVELLVVPVPVKPSLYPERLWQGTDPFALPNNPGYAGFVASLETAGVKVFDLGPTLLDAKREGRQLFLARDTHWTPGGMALAAETVAKAVRGLPLWPDLAAGAEPFDERQVEFEGAGDLAGMLAYAGAKPGRPERLVLTQTIATRSGLSPLSRESPILLLGDSLTAVFSDSRLGLGQRGGFAERLASRLRLPIDVIAMPAGGASRARRALALRPRPLAGKRLVIWQLTQRDLMFAAEGWPLVPLPPDRDDVVSAGDGERFEILAWLVETTRLPETMDYADCLIVSSFRRVDGAMPGSAQNTAGDVMTLGWGIRDWRPTPAASFEPQAFYRLVLEPLPESIDLERTCWLDTVGLEERPWWLVEAESQ